VAGTWLARRRPTGPSHHRSLVLALTPPDAALRCRPLIGMTARAQRQERAVMRHDSESCVGQGLGDAATSLCSGHVWHSARSGPWHYADQTSTCSTSSVLRGCSLLSGHRRATGTADWVRWLPARVSQFPSFVYGSWWPRLWPSWWLPRSTHDQRGRGHGSDIRSAA
jgi:hypothetical protein